MPPNHIPCIKLTISINHLIMLKGRIVLISKPLGNNFFPGYIFYIYYIRPTQIPI